MEIGERGQHFHGVRRVGTSRAPTMANDPSLKCKSCKKPFKAINKHLTQKKECQSKYTKEEMQAISKMLTSARHQRYENANRKERAQKLRGYKLKNKQ